MPAPDQNVARKLEQTFRSILAPPLAAQSIFLFLENEDLPPDDSVKLPAVVLCADTREVWWEMKQSGRYGTIAELKLVCRVDATNPGSAEGIEVLAKTVQTLFETPAPAGPAAYVGWLFLRWDRLGEETGFDDNVRVKTLAYTIRCLPSAS